MSIFGFKVIVVFYIFTCFLIISLFSVFDLKCVVMISDISKKYAYGFVKKTMTYQKFLLFYCEFYGNVSLRGSFTYFTYD